MPLRVRKRYLIWPGYSNTEEVLRRGSPELANDERCGVAIGVLPTPLRVPDLPLRARTQERLL
jgi:hypothetical protein